ncbi:MAG: hypothetical protein H0U75_09095 [Legionella sp.]|nr:hypothetical protein [Legionella sp.]
MKFLFATEPDDYHALLVKRVLEDMGHFVRLLFIADHPTKQKNSIFIDKETYEWTSSDAQGSIVDNKYDVVWWRRVRKPYVPKHIVHPDDYKIALRENTLFYESLTNNMAPTAWWVNSKKAATNAASKLYQLKMAVECGMNIPSTLCGNDPKKIRDFIEENKVGGVIYKPLSINIWNENQQVKVVFTSKINTVDLPRDDLLQFAPGIYQKEIKKLYELRVTCFGDYIVAAKLNSQLHLKGKTDWRKIPDGELSIDPYQLPQELQAKIKKFMIKMGLMFGAFDFIVSEDGSYVFLEVNEQGQFLWIEGYNSEFKMLDIFVNFLINKSARFKWDSQKSQHQMAYYLDDIHNMVYQNQQEPIHVHVTRSVMECQQ